MNIICRTICEYKAFMNYGNIKKSIRKQNHGIKYNKRILYLYFIIFTFMIIILCFIFIIRMTAEKMEGKQLLMKY